MGDQVGDGPGDMERRESRKEMFTAEETELYCVSSLEKLQNEMSEELEKLKSLTPQKRSIQRDSEIKEDVFKKLKEAKDDRDDESGGGEIGPDPEESRRFLESADLDPGDLKDLEDKISNNLEGIFEEGPSCLSSIPESERGAFGTFLIEIIQQLRQNILDVDVLLDDLENKGWKLS